MSSSFAYSEAEMAMIELIAKSTDNRSHQIRLLDALIKMNTSNKRRYETKKKEFEIMESVDAEPDISKKIELLDQLIQMDTVTKNKYIQKKAELQKKLNQPQQVIGYPHIVVGHPHIIVGHPHDVIIDGSGVIHFGLPPGCYFHG